MLIQYENAHLYRWRTLVRDRWRTTKYVCTEDDIRAAEDVEAFEPIEGSLEVRLIPETPEEHAEALRRTEAGRAQFSGGDTLP